MRDELSSGSASSMPEVEEEEETLYDGKYLALGYVLIVVPWIAVVIILWTLSH